MECAIKFIKNNIQKFVSVCFGVYLPLIPLCISFPIYLSILVI